MKNLFKFIFTVTGFTLMLFSFVNCNKDVSTYIAGEEIIITESLPEGGEYSINVSNLKSTSEERRIDISWDKPGDQSNLAFFMVEWKGEGTADATVYTQSVNKSENSFVLDNLYNESYKITVKCVSEDFVSSGGVNITATPVFDTTAPGHVTNVSVEPLAVSAILRWENPTAEDLYKTVITITSSEDPTPKIVELPSYASSYQLIDLDELSEYEVLIESFDYIGNNNSTTTDFKTMAEVLLSNAPWEVIDFSAEETAGEGATGRAKDAIDDNDNTFWHSPWTGGGSSLPQWIVIDLNQEVIPTTLISYKRNNNNNGPTSVKIEGSVDNVEWLDFGTFSLVRDNNDGQNCNLINTKKVRYIKYTVLSSPNNYAMVRNIKIRALVGE